MRADTHEAGRLVQQRLDLRVRRLELLRKDKRTWEGLVMDAGSGWFAGTAAWGMPSIFGA